MKRDLPPCPAHLRVYATDAHDSVVYRRCEHMQGHRGFHFAAMDDGPHWWAGNDTVGVL